MKYKLFGKHTGLLASELVLGAANFGTRRGYVASPEDTQAILSAYAAAGGNFIDVSDQYQLGEAEEIVGEFISHKRSDYIICTKYTRSSEANPGISNAGNHRKAMRQAIEGSLKRLKTDYVDIYMPHFDDGVTPPEEIAKGLDDLVKEGKVLYTGVANFPAWKAAAIAGSSSSHFTAMQVEYNLLQRTADRELLPMAEYFGVGKMLYSPLAGGLLTGKYRHGEQGRVTLMQGNAAEEDERTKAIINALIVIANEQNATPGQVALAWALTKDAFPIIGARTLNQFNDGLKAATIKLTEYQITELNTLSNTPLGYPHELLKTVQQPDVVYR